MPPDPERVLEVRSWFVKGDEVFRSARAGLAAVPPITGDAAFHAQQAVEKAMKGFLTWHDRRFRKTHNLVELGQACAAVEPALGPLLARSAPLTDYVWRFRYPGDADPPLVPEAEAALVLARKAYDGLLKRLPPEVRP